MGMSHANCRPIVQLTEDGEDVVKVWSSRRAAAKAHDVWSTHLSAAIKRGVLVSGYRWRHAVPGEVPNEDNEDEDWVAPGPISRLLVERWAAAVTAEEAFRTLRSMPPQDFLRLCPNGSLARGERFAVTSARVAGQVELCLSFRCDHGQARGPCARRLGDEEERQRVQAHKDERLFQAREASSAARPVVRHDPMTGAALATYPSVWAAARELGIPSTNVTRTVKHNAQLAEQGLPLSRRQVAGYRWSWADAPNPDSRV